MKKHEKKIDNSSSVIFHVLIVMPYSVLREVVQTEIGNSKYGRIKAKYKDLSRAKDFFIRFG
jgi:hypothetical protein